MYSLILMTALTGSADAPQFFNRGASCYGACYGCYGGYGYATASQYHYYAPTCYGSTAWYCHGCYGNYSCYGATYGGCMGYYDGGCYGYGGSCLGYGACHGGNACAGSMYPGGGCVGYAAPHGVIEAPQGGSDAPPMPEAEDSGKTDRAPQERARLVVEVPESTKLYIDGRLMKTQSERRVFQTPELQAGESFYYDVKAELTREGRTFTKSQRVIIRAGEEVLAKFEGLGTRKEAIVTVSR